MFRLIYVKASFFFFFHRKEKERQPNSKYHSTIERSIWGKRERVARSEKLIKFSFAPFFFVENFCRWEGDKNREKKMEGQKKKKKDGEGEGGSDMHRCVYRPFQIGRLGWRWYLEKKHEMIDDRPILVATYGVPYPPGCSYNGHCSNLFPPSWRCHVPDVIWEQIST